LVKEALPPLFYPLSCPPFFLGHFSSFFKSLFAKFGLIPGGVKNGYFPPPPFFIPGPLPEDLFTFLSQPPPPPHHKPARTILFHFPFRLPNISEVFTPVTPGMLLFFFAWGDPEPTALPTQTVLFGPPLWFFSFFHFFSRWKSQNPSTLRATTPFRVVFFSSPPWGLKLFQGTETPKGAQRLLLSRSPPSTPFSKSFFFL